ncbi:MAG: protein translocase subunit SecF [Halobacteriovoraceae bacterium]|nr:protein translocase subunit SecF [Peredibacter sp.]MBJ00926.1 protein translocase subunit SecF [Halobacteriovoraceae bacterium]|tara:strand:+ start:3345 stop:4247 length:903 start_codon:yes stop_codon:yes gene_type:complete
MSKFNISFVSKFPVSVVLSAVLVIGSLSLFFSKGLNYGVDFRGGAEIQVAFEKETQLEELRSSLDANKFDSSSVQRIGSESQNEFLVKVASNEANLNQVTDQITKMLQKDFSDKGSEILKTDIVGPKAGEQLRISGFQAMAWALLMIMIYIALRFDYKYSPGAIVALLHDVIIIVGIFSLLGKEFSLQIVGALLAVIGYSVNDTVVVYDRVREHEEKYSSRTLKEQINGALNETLTRTILTSITTLIVAGVMYFMGGGIIQDFFFAICIGVIVGTYSSIFVAAPTVLFFDKITGKKGDAA